MDNRHGNREKNSWLLLISACLLVYLCGWYIPLMEIDAAQYANMSREMLIHKNFLQLYDRGADYLDKPPMLFWISAASMRLFGINDLAYRLPSLLFAILSIYSTFRFSKLYYEERMAYLSALVLASCQALFLITHDVRTDTMLLGWVMFSIWQLASWYKEGKWIHLVLSAVSVACGMMTKGPIALLVPVFAFVPHFLLQRRFRQLFRWEYLLMILIIGILLIPMTIGLYQQFDLHPEKTMYAQKGTSGIRFFYWTQSFGRITGESTWHENDSFLFLFQNMLWGFLPWSIFFILGIVSQVWRLAREKFRISGDQEWVSTGGFLVTYSALASSRFQLPHYIYVVFPLAAIIAGRWLFQLLYGQHLTRWVKPLLVTQIVTGILLSAGLFLLLVIPFPPPNLALIALALVAFAILTTAIEKKWVPLPSMVTVSVMAILFINVFLDLGFYPRLLQYQTSVKVSRFISKNHIAADHVFIYMLDEERSLHFYCNHSFVHVTSPDSLRQQDYLLTSADGMASIQPGRFRLIFSGEGFHVSTLTVPFLNPSTRRRETKPYFLLQKI